MSGHTGRTDAGRYPARLSQTEVAALQTVERLEAELAEAKQLLGKAACGDCGSNLRGRIEAFLTKGQTNENE